MIHLRPAPLKGEALTNVVLIKFSHWTCLYLNQPSATVKYSMQPLQM